MVMLSNNGMHPTPHQQLSHIRCLGARVMPGVISPESCDTKTSRKILLSCRVATKRRSNTSLKLTANKLVCHPRDLEAWLFVCAAA